MSMNVTRSTGIRIRDIAEQAGISVDELAAVAGVATTSETIDGDAIVRVQRFLDEKGLGRPVATTGGNAAAQRSSLENQIEKKANEPPVVDGARAPQPFEVQPNLWAHTLGQHAQLAQWIDQNVGNGDGVITVDELDAFCQRYGHDARYRNGIVGIAMYLGQITLEVNGRVMLARNGQVSVRIDVGSGGAYTNTYQPPANNVQRTSGNPAWDIAAKLVRGYGSASQHEVNTVATILSQAPMPVLRILEARGYQVMVCGVISEARPDMRYERPRGFPPGHTWDNAGGAHDPNRRQILIPRAGMDARAIMHEVGHALDIARGGMLCTGATFMRMYNADYNMLVRNGETYLTQPGDAGPSEGFAESFGRYRSNPWGLQSSYPNLFAYWKWVEENGWREVGG
jgi:hypothetical protein